MKRTLLSIAVFAGFHCLFLFSAMPQDKVVTADGQSIPLVRPWDTRPQVAGFFAKQLYSRTSFADAPTLELFYEKILGGSTPIFCQFYSDCTNAQALANRGDLDLAKVFADHAAGIRVAANNEIRALSLAVEIETKVAGKWGSSGFVDPVKQIQIHVTTTPASRP